MQDLRYALRILGKSPMFAIVAGATLLLGIGANVTMFTFVDAALLRPLPFREPARLMQVFETRHTDIWAEIEASYPDYRDWRAQQGVFVELAGFSGAGSTALRGQGPPQRVTNAIVTDNFFRALTVLPILGRDFRPGEESVSAPAVVMLSYRCWIDRFGGNPEVIGKSVTLGETIATIVGVLPAEFRFAPTGEADFWLPLRATRGLLERRNLHWLNVIGRLKPGVTREQSYAAMDLIMQRLIQQYPVAGQVQGLAIRPLIDVVVGGVRPILLMLLTAVGLLLLIACANVANLLLARSASRRKEIAVRSALGASRGRIVQQLMIEGFVLASIGALGGLLSARWLVQALARRLPDAMRRSMGFLADVKLDASVIGFACGVTILTAVLFALAPAILMTRTDVQEALRDGTRTSRSRSWSRFASGLVVAELSLAVVLLSGAGLLIKSFHRFLVVDPGFNPDHLLALNIATPNSMSSAQERAFARDALAQISALPGVQSVATTSTEPLRGGNTIRFRHAGEVGREGEEANIRDITPGYFQTLGAHLIRGRQFTESDDENAPQVLIINQTFAKMFFRGSDAVGQEIVFTYNPTQKPRQIVGIVADLKEAPLDAEPRPAVYLPFKQDGGAYVVMVRTGPAPEALATSVTEAIRRANPDVLVYNPRPAQMLIDQSPAAYLHRYPAWLTMAFAGFALMLATLGLYGMVAYSVSQRTREIGIRLALGAHPPDVVRMVLSEALRMTALGIGIGIVGAAFSGQLLRGMLFGVSAWDPQTLLIVSGLSAGVALAASYLQARRASQVDPIVALRYE